MGAGQTQVGAIYDVILNNGAYMTGVPGERLPEGYEQVCEIKGMMRWPILGWFLRNHWAKSRGAQLPGTPFSG
ncbi:MAG: hypothetical protein H6510_09965 [Acidobacteria bacterium]|nr:hypothetical protein [Acidobacteriota bacterium]MCB9398133.1 hypothetical protein [Acidobacteriota bacterium]